MIQSTFEFLDFLAIVIKHKITLILIFIISLFSSYGLIYFFVEEQFDAETVIIPSGQNSLAGVSSLMKNISSVLPIGIGDINKESEMDLYNTIIYSRTSIETLIEKFGLKAILKIQRREELHKAVRKMIKAKVTIENAYTISVRANSRQLSSDMANFIVEYVNKKIVELNSAKSKNNRLFLEKRYRIVSDSLTNAEDNLKKFQETEGVFDASEQVNSTIEVFTKLESDLAAKQIEYSVMSQIYGNSSPNATTAKVAIDEYKRKIEAIKSGKEKRLSVVTIDSLPEKALQYYRYYRDVKINEEMLKFILPLYEQSKFDEQRDIPILQVIDKAIAPERKSYPPRTAFAGIIAFATTCFAALFLIVNDLVLNSNNPKIELLKKNLFRFKSLEQ
jgi:capsule polysaccharide export protein KpsE/RkpR